jgi:hypothetical protein
MFSSGRVGGLLFDREERCEGSARVTPKTDRRDGVEAGGLQADRGSNAVEHETGNQWERAECMPSPTGARRINAHPNAPSLAVKTSTPMTRSVPIHAPAPTICTVSMARLVPRRSRALGTGLGPHRRQPYGDPVGGSSLKVGAGPGVRTSTASERSAAGRDRGCRGSGGGRVAPRARVGDSRQRAWLSPFGRAPTTLCR